MNKQMCECGQEFSLDEHNRCPACGSLPTDVAAYASSCEYKTNGRGAVATAQKEGVGHKTSMEESNAVKKTEAEIRKLRT